MWKQVFLVVVTLFAVIACDKEKEPEPPVITIDSPYEGQPVTAGDTISIKGSAMSQEHLNSVTINLLDKDMISVQPAIAINVDGKSAVFNEDFVVSRDLVSSDYFIQVVASSSSSKITRKYVKLNLNGSAGKSKTCLVFTGSSFQTGLSSFDSSYTVKNRYTFQGGYLHSAVFGQGPSLGISFSNEDLHVLSLADFTLKWTLPGSTSSSLPYKGLYGTDVHLYVSHAENGFVRSYNEDKVPAVTSYMASSHTPDDLFISNGLLFVDEKPVSSSESSKLTVRYLPSGYGKQEAGPGFDIVSFIEKNSDQIYVFGNDGQQGHMKIYTVSGNGFNTIHALPSGRVIKAVKVNDDDLLILTETEILSYRYSTNSMVPYLTVSARAMLYDSERSELLVASGTDVKIYNYTNKQIKRTVQFSAPVLDIRLVAL